MRTAAPDPYRSGGQGVLIPAISKHRSSDLRRSECIIESTNDYPLAS